MHREETNSITHLVKIVAEETTTKVFEKLKVLERLERLEKDRTIPSGVGVGARTGEAWGISEDLKILNNFHDFVNRTAIEFNRSSVAIKMRLIKNLNGN